MSSEYKAAIYRDKSLPLDQRLKELEGGLAWAANDAAADLVREAREALEPFAKVAADYEAADKRRIEMHREEGRNLKETVDGHRVSIGLGDCRRARGTLLANIRQGGD